MKARVKSKKRLEKEDGFKYLVPGQWDSCGRWIEVRPTSDYQWLDPNTGYYWYYDWLSYIPQETK